MQIHERLLARQQFSPQDLELISCRRREHNQVGFAYQLIFVRILNRFPKQSPFEVIDELVLFVIAKTGLSAENIDSYGLRRETVAEHQELLRRYLGLEPFHQTNSSEIEKFIFHEALRLEQTSALLVRTREFLRSQKILEPTEGTLSRLIQTQRQAARSFIFAKIAEEADEQLKQQLDLFLQPGDEFYSTFNALKAPPGRPSPSFLKKLSWKLEKLEESGVLCVDLSWLNNNFQRSQARYVRRCTASRLRELRDERRYAALVCFFHQLYRDTLDALTATFEKLIGLVWKRAKNELNEHNQRDRKKRQASLANYQLILELVLDQEITDINLRKAIFEEIEREELLQEAESVKTWLTGNTATFFNSYKAGTATSDSSLPLFYATFPSSPKMVRAKSCNYLMPLPCSKR